eukprot:TRINITY_DN230_c3_g1_i1.p1 TRINITY_DN230_c3_g1~~TRINITY_DN230_c3_g1_i1.p1  ORF type:complete len:110 (+),score=25.11 TRINITY_DN230_c3_g1_i1:45-374(+)
MATNNQQSKTLISKEQEQEEEEEEEEQEFKIEEVSKHNTIEDGWIILNNFVFDITDYLQENIHPGGTILLSNYLGQNATEIWNGPGPLDHKHSNQAFKLLQFYKIGKLI